MSSLAAMPDVTTDLRLAHLRALEAESIHIFREVVAEFERPVMLYSIGKDSSVLLRLAQKPFYPCPIPFPLLHVDTTYKFREMIQFRDDMARAVGARLIVHTNDEAIADGTQPFKVGTQRCCGLLKTKSLLDALQAGNFDAAIGGPRRGGEGTRGEERAAARAATRGDPAPRRGCPPSATPTASGIRSGSGPNCGTCSTDACGRAKASACFRCRTGPGSTSGSTSISSRFRSFRSTTPKSARSSSAAIR